MTYQQIFYLKYKKGIPTSELIQRFPKQAFQVSEVALLDLSDDVLEDIIEDEDRLDHLRALRKKYVKFITK